MPGYYLYFFGTDGHIRSREDLVCATDAEAIEIAEHHADGSEKELWLEKRIIQRFAARRQEA
jgi:hypothetical protein